MLGKFIIAYIDDILIYSPSLNSHVTHFRQDMFQLFENQLYMKSEKCEFQVSSVSFWNTSSVRRA